MRRGNEWGRSAMNSRSGRRRTWRADAGPTSEDACARKASVSSRLLNRRTARRAGSRPREIDDFSKSITIPRRAARKVWLPRARVWIPAKNPQSPRSGSVAGAHPPPRCALHLWRFHSAFRQSISRYRRGALRSDLIPDRQGNIAVGISRGEVSPRIGGRKSAALVQR